MERVNITIGPLSFDHADWPAPVFRSITCESRWFGPVLVDTG